MTTETNTIYPHNLDLGGPIVDMEPYSGSLKEFIEVLQRVQEKYEGQGTMWINAEVDSFTLTSTLTREREIQKVEVRVKNYKSQLASAEKHRNILAKIVTEGEAELVKLKEQT